MNRFRWLLACAGAVAVASCKDTTGAIGDQLLGDAMAQWAEVGPPSYSYVLHRGCSCEGPTNLQGIVVTVENNAITSWKYQADGTDLEAQWQSAYPAVPGLFQIIVDARAASGFLIQAQYNQIYGFPEIVNIDLNPGRIDDNIAYTATDFTPLP